MRRIKLTIGYDGTDFCGWQIQSHERTVQYEIEKALEIMHGHHVRIHGSGRTDSGVHAVGQAAHFDTDIASIEPERFMIALNSMMPKDVRIYASDLVPESFHARYSATLREYRYIIKEYAFISPMEQRYCLGVPRFPDVQRLNGYTGSIIGIHDFTAFTAAGDMSKSKVRNIHQAYWYIDGTSLVFTITGNAFLWKMVRSLIGTMLELNQREAPPDQMRMILESGDRLAVGSTAAPQGLCLERIMYEQI